VARLFADDQGPTLVCLKCGKGTVILMPGGWPLSNSGISRGDNLAIMLNALDYRMPGGKPVVTFDEFHHGYGSGKGIMSLISTPAKLGLAEMFLAFLLILASGLVRFGRVIPLSEGVRQRGEYLSSMSALLRKARATGLVRAELGRRFLASMASAAGLPPNAHPRDIADSASARYPAKAREIHELCDAANSTDDHPSEAAVLALAKKWHKLRKELTK